MLAKVGIRLLGAAWGFVIVGLGLIMIASAIVGMGNDFLIILFPLLLLGPMF